MRSSLIVFVAFWAAACESTTPPTEVTTVEPATPSAATDPGAGGPTTGAPGDGGAVPVSSLPPPPPPAPPAPPLPPFELTSETIDVGGVTRSFVLSKPTSYSPAAPYPLVLSLHGDGGDGAAMQAAQPFESASRQAAIVVYPSGTDRGWNLYTPADQNADLAFLVALVDSLRARFVIDPTRIFATGISSGGFMVNQLACRRSTLVRAIAPQSGGAPAEPYDPAATTWGNGHVRCAGQTTGVAVMVIHGKLDEMVVYESGNNTAHYWSHVNGCTATRIQAVPAPCVQQADCPTGKPVVFCAIDNLGHTMWPEAAKASWDFFSGL